MAGFALPKLRWLVVGAIAAGIWVVREDMKAPRPPEPVSASKRVSAGNQTAAEKPRPQKPVVANPAGTRQAVIRPKEEKPVPPRPVTGRQQPTATAPQKTALALPETVERPPSRPQKIVTGSIARPGRQAFVQTKTRVRLRAQARQDAEVIATLQPHIIMRELARSGEWLLVMGDGRKGWVHTNYVEASTFLKRRPRLPVSEVKQAKAATAKKARDR